MNENISILIACGSGIATSTVAQEKVKEILKKENISAKIVKSSINEIPNKKDKVDLILVTSKYTKDINKPVIPVFGLISGVNKENVEKEILTECKNILKIRKNK